VTAPAYTVKARDETTWQAFAALVEQNNGIFGGCWCMGFHPREAGQGRTTAALNRERKLTRVRGGTAHAALVFDGEDCVGWCQFGEPAEVPRIKNRASSVITAATSPLLARSRLPYPDWRGRHGNMTARCARAYRIRRRPGSPGHGAPCSRLVEQPFPGAFEAELTIRYRQAAICPALVSSTATRGGQCHR
jgi:hypothetical protein